jgi:predicted DNA binding CopG/RHH family protein
MKKIPVFKSEDAERDFWATHDITDYFQIAEQQKGVFLNLKPSTETISIRLPKYLLAQIKELANAQDVPYQSFMKMLLAESIKKRFI